MKNKYYYALWIPVLHKTNFKIIGNPKPKILQDSKEFSQYIIAGKMEKGTLDFHLSYKEEKRESEKQLVFHCEGKWSVGILVYSIEFNNPPANSLEKSLQSKMPTFIYHYIKDFFHKHIHHHPSHDSLLQACFSDKPLSLSSDANRKKIMEYYATCYLKKFNAHAHNAQYMFILAKENINSRLRINKGIKQLEFILNEGREILGEAEFCHALTTMGASSIRKEIHTSISEIIESIHQLQQHVSFAYNLCTSSYGIKLGWWGIWFGGFGILTSIITFIVSYRLSLNHEPDYSPIINEIDSIGRENRMHLEKVIRNGQMEIDIRLDSINKRINNE